MTTPSQDGEDGEVVEVFTGDTLEEAMAAAVEALGPDLAVRRARKVRAGVRGLLGRDRYEVLAVPAEGGARASAPPGSGDAVGDALDALLDAADEREASGPQARPVSRPGADRPLSARPTAADPPPPAAVRPTPLPLPPAPRSGGSPSRRAARPSPGPAPELPDVLEAEGTEPPARRRRGLGLPLAGRAPHPDPTVGDHPDPPVRPLRRRRTDAGAPAPDSPPARPAPARPVAPSGPPAVLRALPGPGPVPPAVRAVPPVAAPAAAAAAAGAGAAAARTTPRGAAARRPRAAGGWSRAALAALGVPEPVLDALPDTPPADDLAWVVALTAAIEAVVPAPAEPDDAHPVVVSGHGLAGAVAVLDAGCRGLTPGTLGHAGRTVPATATELALVLRHHVTGG